MIEPLASGTRVEVEGFRGVACIVLGPEQVWEPVTYLAEEGPHGAETWVEDPFDGEWVDGDGARVRVVMVGDHEWTVDAGDCTPLSEDDYCSECGQVGMLWGWPRGRRIFLESGRNGRIWKVDWKILPGR